MSASKQVSYLRKLKYKLSKNTLDKLYCTYIRPLLEYGSEVWDGCLINDTNRLEQVQLNAARIVTGFPIFASLHLYTLKLIGEFGGQKTNQKVNLNEYYYIYISFM